MQRDKLTSIRDYIVKNSKFLFPVVLIAAVALTVSFALNAGNQKDSGESPESVEESAEGENEPVVQAEATPEPEPPAPEEAPLAVNEDEDIRTLILQYYNAMAAGDSAVMTSIYDEISENEIGRAHV